MTKAHKLQYLPIDPTQRRRYLNAVRRYNDLTAKHQAGRFLSTQEVAARNNASRIIREFTS